MPAAVLYPENTLIAKRFQDKVQQPASDKEADRNPCPFCCVLMTDKLGKFLCEEITITCTAGVGKVESRK